MHDDDDELGVDGESGPGDRVSGRGAQRGCRLQCVRAVREDWSCADLRCDRAATSSRHRAAGAEAWKKGSSAAPQPVRCFAKVEVRAAVAASLRLRLMLANGRRAELEIADVAQLARIVAALEAVA